MAKKPPMFIIEYDRTRTFLGVLPDNFSLTSDQTLCLLHNVSNLLNSQIPKHIRESLEGLLTPPRMVVKK